MDGRLNLKFMGDLADLPENLSPWFCRMHASLADKTVIAGHWSALGLHLSPQFIGIDTGCIWGRKLTAVRLEDRMVYQVPCAESLIPTGWD
jgi:bis(5'-nucleosyl)-tetraphosphatase (symmetrical)